MPNGISDRERRRRSRGRSSRRRSPRSTGLTFRSAPCIRTYVRIRWIAMQLSFDAADRLVELIHTRRGAVSPEEAARALFALERAPATLAHSLLTDVVQGDARLEW